MEKRNAIPRNTQGNGIVSITKTATVGSVDTYTITYTDGTTTTYTVQNGEVTNAELAEAIRKLLPTDTSSGAVASFPDGADDVLVDDLTISIDPVQDLHGYENPWPAGGGKNKIAPSAVGTKTNHDVTFVSDGNGKYTLSGTANGGASTLFDLEAPYTIQDEDYLHIFNSAAIGTFTLRFSDNTNGYPSMNPANRIYALTNYVGRTLVAIGFSIPSGSAFNGIVQPMICNASSATAWSPYSNICPISGWTGANVSRTGKNLYDNAQYPFTQYSVYNPAVCRTPPIFVKHGTYTFSCSSGFGVCYITVYKTFEDATANANSLAQYTFNNGSSVTRTFDEDVYVRYQQNSTGGIDEDYAKVSQSWQSELGSTATDYEPYSGDTFSVSWESEAGTVYGGTLDVVNGALTVDRAMVDLGTLGWTMNASGTYKMFYSTTIASQVKPPATPVIVPNIISSQYVAVNFVTAYLGNVNDVMSITDATSDARGNINIVDDRYTDTTAFKQAMSGVQLCYELATPITYSLTPTEIKTLLGQNNIWADTGDSSVTYRADIQKYIEKTIST